MKVAIPTIDGILCAHFGHCSAFAIVEVDDIKRTIGNVDIVPSPAHQPGLLPGWLAQYGASVIIAGGMGQRAISLFDQHGIEVVTGAPASSPQDLVQAYLDGSLQSVGNACDHDGPGHGGGRCRH